MAVDLASLFVPGRAYAGPCLVPDLSSGPREQPAEHGAVEGGHDDVAVAWDRLVEEAKGGDLVQTAAWGRTKRAIGLRTHLAVLHDSAGDVVGGAQIVAKRLAPGFAAGYVARGPLVREESPAVARGVVEEVLSRARDVGMRLLIVQPPEGGQAVERALDERRFETGGISVAPDATLKLDVRRSDEELLARMSRMRRRSLGRPAPEHFSVAAEADPELFHRLHHATAARLGFTPIDLRALLAQWEELRPRRCAIIVARHRGLPVCALWVTAYAGTVTAKLGGWDRGAERSGAPSNANAAVHWEAVRWARASGAHTFDFGGIDRAAAEALLAGERPPPGFTAGPSFFKHGFGGTPVLLPLVRWGLLVPGAGVARPIVRRLLASPLAGSAMHRTRNG